jgi:hypothetical protein
MFISAIDNSRRATARVAHGFSGLLVVAIVDRA